MVFEIYLLDCIMWFVLFYILFNFLHGGLVFLRLFVRLFFFSFLLVRRDVAILHGYRRLFAFAFST